jgi:hypothetical protein
VAPFGGRHYNSLMQVYLFKSLVTRRVLAVALDPFGATLPGSLGPWVPYGIPGKPMEHVTAVSDRIQAALDARGCCVMEVSKTE